MPTMDDVEAAAVEFGFEIDEAAGCPIQGVLIAFSRPVRNGESLLGLPVAGPLVRSEVIERHFCPGDADDEVVAVTWDRACQRALWAMEAEGRV
jgi:molybdopterin-guanine dinucleotide biosynthesis protein A